MEIAPLVVVTSPIIYASTGLRVKRGSPYHSLWEKGVAMGLIEAILIGVQFKRLEKPIVFLSMLVCFLAFCTFGVAIILASVEGFSDGKSFLASVGFSSFSFIFFGLAAVCGHFIKKCVR